MLPITPTLTASTCLQIKSLLKLRPNQMCTQQPRLTPIPHSAPVDLPLKSVRPTRLTSNLLSLMQAPLTLMSQIRTLWWAQNDVFFKKARPRNKARAWWWWPHCCQRCLARLAAKRRLITAKCRARWSVKPYCWLNNNVEDPSSQKEYKMFDKPHRGHQ